MLKFSKKYWNLPAITSKLVQIGPNFDIYLFTIDFIWSLGIYNCDKDHREVEKSDIKTVFFIILGINMLKFSGKYWNLFAITSKLVKILIFISSWLILYDP